MQTHQFVKRPKAFGSHTGLDARDYFRSMHVERKDATTGHHDGTPEWVNNNATLQKVILAYLEQRFYIYKPLGSPEERLAAIQAKALDCILPLRCKLVRLQNRYAIASEHERPKLASAIQGADRELVTLERGVAKIVASIIYKYYRLGYSSVTIAEQMGLTPAGVRQTVNQLHRAWRLIGDQSRQTRYAPGGKLHGKGSLTPERYRKIFLMRSSGWTWSEIAGAFGVRHTTGKSALSAAYHKYGRPLRKRKTSPLSVRMTKREDGGVDILYRRIPV